MTPLSVLLTAPTSASVRASAVSMLTSLGIPAGNWKAGGLASSMLTVTCSLLATVIGALVTTVLSAPFLPISPAPWNAILAYYVYGIKVNQATYASGFINLTNPGGGIYTKAVGQAIFANSNTGVQYTNTVPFTLGANSTITGIAVQAEILGSVGSAIAGGIDTVVTPMNAVTVTNPLPVVGIDADPPAVVKAKCLASIASRTYQGPNGAFQYAVATAVNSQGNPVNINRWSVVTDRNSGDVTVYVASPAGAPTTDDILAVQMNVTAVAQPQGILATVVPATVIPLSASPTTITIWARGAGTSSTPTTIGNEVSTNVDDQLETYPISGIANPPSTQGYLYAAWLSGVIFASDPLIYDITGLPEDIPLSAGQVAELTSATTFVVRQVP